MIIRWTYAFVDRPAARLPEARAFWAAVTGTRPSEPRGEQGEFMTLLPDAGEGADACVKLQGVAEGDGGAHLDLCAEDVGQLAGAARELGADLVADHGDWAVLRSPAGQLFCAVRRHDETVRPPVVAGSRLDQVCLDIPPSAYAAESDFWAALTGWERLRGSRPEFEVLRPPTGLPVRILLQRLDDGRPASAHLDLACADVAEVRARHEELGAVAVHHGPHWSVMRDPAGGIYCLTGRDPQTGALPGH
ncbi:VOC family protein [Streptomyces sp. FXJ1.172]|uniref:VOC family protein n=1 Tax=Streptomyces sp. FXJ1.172 TaxID=710705 RepID=UPI0007D0039E|nr:VOC family protein [Streptomyces sp. FXJ1.172]WEP00216.1 VOC family protein [Streptomyces sp. FXJ1.172]